jgi:sigma-B regulation protein RsbU (phosphoserine phosphatase)
MHMKIESYRDDPTLAALTTLLRGLTSSRTAQEAFASFMRHYWKVRPVDCLLGVVRDSSGPGRFRIIYHVARGHVENDHPLPARNPGAAWNEEAVVHEGGVIATLIEGDEPRMAFELDLSRDPVLKEMSPNCVTAMALPVFAGEGVTEWVIGLSRVRDGFAVENVRNALLTANFMAMANSHLLFVEEYRELNKQLTAQFEDVARVQQALLPRRTPVVPGLEIATSYLTSDIAGGDYYDVQALPTGGMAS